MQQQQTGQDEEKKELQTITRHGDPAAQGRSFQVPNRKGAPGQTCGLWGCLVFSKYAHGMKQTPVSTPVVKWVEDIVNLRTTPLQGWAALTAVKIRAIFHSLVQTVADS